MAINLADKYSSVVDELFTTGSKTNIAFNSQYDWNGVQSVKVYSIPTVAMVNYNRGVDPSTASRYGAISELQDQVQVMTIRQDRAFTFSIDKGNNIEQVYVKNAGVRLAAQIREKVIPELDQYRLASLIANAGHIETEAAAPTAANAYETLLKGNAHLSENNVPEAGRVLFTTYEFLNLIKLDPSFNRGGDMNQGMTINGMYGTIDGLPIIPIASSMLPEKVNFLLVHPSAACAPVQLDEAQIHIDPMFISGHLVEGRIIYDTFVLNNKRDAIYASVNP